MQKRLNPIHARVDCTLSSLTSVPGPIPGLAWLYCLHCCRVGMYSYITLTSSVAVVN